MRGSSRCVGRVLAAGVTLAAVTHLASAAGDPLAALNDEFGNPATLAQWSRLYQTEGWGANQLRTFEIGGATPGHLTMVPHTSVWYQDYKAELAYKTVTGDFRASTRVRISDLDADAGTIPGRQFDLAGLMARAPRNVTPATWATGGENYVFIALGNGQRPNDSFQIEEKTTAASNSDLQLRDVASGEATLEIARLGNVFVTLYRVGQSPWQVFRRHERADLPATLQVGMHAYTDWDNARQLDPFVHNSNVVPEAPGVVPGTGVSGLPDLQADFDWVRFSTPDVPAVLAGANFLDSNQVSDAALIAMLHAAPIPEPTTYWFLLIGVVLVLGWLALRQRIK